MPHGDWDDISEVQKSALQALGAMPTGCGYPRNVARRVRLATWDALHRYSLIRTEDHGPVQWGNYIWITDSGRESIGDNSHQPEKKSGG